MALARMPTYCIVIYMHIYYTEKSSIQYDIGLAVIELNSYICHISESSFVTLARLEVDHPNM